MLKTFVRRIKHRWMIPVVLPGVLFILLASCYAPLTTSCVPRPSMSIVRTGPTYGRVGEPVTFTYLVSNTGSLPISNVTVIDNQYGSVVYSGGDVNHDGVLETSETWVFTCSYVPPFNCSEPFTNTVTVMGVWEDQVAVDTASFTLYPCVLRKQVLLYLGEENISYTDLKTSFPVELSEDGDVLATFLINESAPICLWLSQGTYLFTEGPVPSGYLCVSQNVSFTTGVDSPEVWLVNVITFDLGITKTGPASCRQHDLITYQYTVTNRGPASVTPLVVDDRCGVPVYLSGDNNTNGFLDPSETWSYMATCNVTAEPGTVLTNNVSVTDKEGAGGSWVLGGDRNLSNNNVSWSVQVLPPEYHNKTWYTLSVEAVGNGSVVIDPDQVSYENGSVVNLTAVVDTGWVFDHWGGDLNGTVNSTQVLMDRNKTVVAYFKEQEQQRNEYWINVSVIGNGSVLRDPDLALYPAGTEVQLTGLADPGWVFDHWAGNLSGNQTPVMLPIDGNKSVTAFFIQIRPREKMYTLTVRIVGNGTVERDPDQVFYMNGTVVMLTAVADTGWVFDHWGGDLSGNISSVPLTMDANKSVWVYFVQQESKKPTPPSSTRPHGHSTNIPPVADAGGPYDGLVGEDVVMNGLGSHDPDGFLIAFSWSFGDGTSGTGTTLMHRYLQRGTFVVTLTVVDNFGGQATNTTVAHIMVPNHPPSNPVIIGPSEGVKATDYSYSFRCSDPDNDTLSYRIDWDDWSSFPAGIVPSDTLFVLEHRWATPGTYTITITVSDGQYSASSIKMVTIHDALVVSNIAILVLYILLLLVLILVYLASRRKAKSD